HRRRGQEVFASTGLDPAIRQQAERAGHLPGRTHGPGYFWRLGESLAASGRALPGLFARRSGGERPRAGSGLVQGAERHREGMTRPVPRAKHHQVSGVVKNLSGSVIPSPSLVILTLSGAKRKNLSICPSG